MFLAVDNKRLEVTRTFDVLVPISSFVGLVVAVYHGIDAIVNRICAAVIHGEQQWF